MTELQKAILKTFVYADLFDYPLRQEEAYRFLLADSSVSKRSFQIDLAGFPRMKYQNGFWFLSKRKAIIQIRGKRGKLSQPKLKIAQRVASWLRLIPWIKMVAVTGALAMENSDQKDDVDLMVITRKNRLWLTRLLAIFLTELVAQRRRPDDKEVKDKICLNMFLDENHLRLPQKEQDLFSAHEVCQLKLLWDKDNVYQKFIKQNRWVKKFLPNWRP